MQTPNYRIHVYLLKKLTLKLVVNYLHVINAKIYRLGQVVLSQSSIIWYWPNGSAALRLGRYYMRGPDRK